MLKLKLLLIGISLTLLPACQKVNSNTCGVLFNYSNDFQKKAAKEYPNLPENSKVLIDDYKTTRDTIRVCITN